MFQPNEENRQAELPLHVKSTMRYCALVIDDEEAMRGMLGIALRQHGLTVLSAANGQEAIRLYERHYSTINLVVLDVRMPGLDGPQTLAALWEINPRICCCFMSGDTGKYSEEELLALGAIAVFRKPFRLNDVAEEIRELANHAA